MLLATRTGGQCASCAFKSSRSLSLIIGRFSSTKHHPRGNDRSKSFSRANPDRVNGRKERWATCKPPHVDAPDAWSPRRQPARRLSDPPRVRTEERRQSNIGSPHEIKTGVKRIFRRDIGTVRGFGKLLQGQLEVLRRRLSYKDNAQTRAWGIKSDEELHDRVNAFGEKLLDSCTLAEAGEVDNIKNPVFSQLRKAFITGGLAALSPEMKYAFIDHVVDANFTALETTNQEKIADLRNPLDWYPATRAMQRTIHLHVGPTNSGKTYQALQQLEKAKTGIYAGPLRLLAHEVYSRFNAKGIQCALITGEEQRIPEGMFHVMNSCTVEMVPLNTKVDVAVIDEIQMMGDADRGWAWTQAFLGVQAKEVHLCGELRSVDLVTNLCKAMGDELIIHRYDRLNPLKPMNKSLSGDLKNLRAGDAVILFSRIAIHAMKADIEKITGKRCAVVYGSLPPETRAQQAALFNDPDNEYDFLVASDAVGMGLNLSIKRIIFEATSKHDGQAHKLITVSEIRQIAGRAGRYKTAREASNTEKNVAASASESQDPSQLGVIKKKQNVGFVTTLEPFDLPIVREAMDTDPQPLKTAGIFPPSEVLLQFASYFPKRVPFSYIVLRLHGMSTLNDLFHMCLLKEQIDVADLIQAYELSNMDRVILMNAPTAMRDPGSSAVVAELARCIADQSGGELLSLKSLNLELLDEDIHGHTAGPKGYLRDAESLHKAITLYLWLSYRFTGIFRSQALAFHVKSLVEKKIDECLLDVSWDTGERKLRQKTRQKALEKQFKDMGKLTQLEDIEAIGKESDGIEVADLNDLSESEGKLFSSSEQEATPRPDIVNA